MVQYNKDIEKSETDMGKWILQEENYKEQIEMIVEPYLEKRRTELWLERENEKKIYCVRCLADHPKGVVMVSHGFTENVEKYKEILYYFLKAGYHVYMPEHCGHGHSYRLTEDMSLVHVDSYKRYVRDFLFVCGRAKKEHPELPMFLYGHSMGGGIAATCAAVKPNRFKKVVLSSPMIRPLTGKVPWHDAKTIAKAFCKAGLSTRYIAGQTPYHGPGKFENSSSLTKEQYEYYQEKRREDELLQLNAASYGWLLAASSLNRYLQKEGSRRIKSPLLLFQAERDHLVSKKEQVRFILRLNANGAPYAKIVRVPGTKHEIFHSDARTKEAYWRMVFRFFE